MTLPPVRRTNPFARPRAPSEPIAGVSLLGSERVNFYAVTEGRSVTLVDCGFYGHLRYLDAWLCATGRQRSDIEAVVITHGHADHLGFAEVLGRQGIPVYVPLQDLELARTTRVREPPLRLRRRLWRPSCMALFLEAVFDSVFTQPAAQTAIGYAWGSTLDVPGRLHAIGVPGHSHGNACLHLPAQDVLFTGDALMTRDPMGTARGPLVFSEDPARDGVALENLSLLAPFRSAAMLPAHGEPWTFRGAVGRAIEGARIA